jgi:hypothetical protein
MKRHGVPALWFWANVFYTVTASDQFEIQN